MHPENFEFDRIQDGQNIDNINILTFLADNIDNPEQNLLNICTTFSLFFLGLKQNNLLSEKGL